MESSIAPRSSQTSPVAPKAPANLSKEAKEWWAKIVSTWRFDDGGLLLLTLSLELSVLLFQLTQPR